MIRDDFYQYIQSEKRFSGHTLVAYHSDLDQFGKYMQLVYEISDDKMVTYSMVRSWLAHLVDEGLASRSVNRKLSSLKAYFGYLNRRGYRTDNPVRRAVSLAVPSRLPAFVTEHEMQQTLKQPAPVTGFSTFRDLMILEILYSTGIRLSELLGLCINDVDTGALTIKVTGKRNKQRIIPITAEFVKLLGQYLEARSAIAEPGTNEIILTDKGKKAYPVFIYRKVRYYLSVAGVKGARSPHVLRHTFATHLLNGGSDLNAIKELLGHASLAATQVYTHTNIEKLKSIYKHAHPRA